MNYNSRRGGQIIDSLHSMLATITQISKNSQNFHQLEELLPLMTDLRKADVVNNKEIAQSIKTISEIVPKLKSKVVPSSRGNDSASQVYDRMANHLNFELNKLTAQIQGITTKSSQIQSYQEQQIKSQAAIIIKQIEQILASSKKVVLGSITQKRKYYLNEANPNHYLYSTLQKRLKATNIRQRLQSCKYEFGEFRNIYNEYESNIQNIEQKADILKIQNGKETGMNQDILKKLQSKIQIEKRKSFISKCEEHLQKQYSFVLKNLQKLNHIKTPGRYEQNLFHHYYSWGKRLKVLLQTILIKLSSFDRNKLNIKQQQAFTLLCKESTQKYQKMLAHLMNELK